MAKQNSPQFGSWLLAQELFERADPGFIDEFRKVAQPEKTGAFAERWLQDRRPEARALLLQYLDQPLNSFRHEAFVKRLFKQAEKAGDDQVMGALLAAFDRALRRVRKKRHQYDWKTRESWVEEYVALPSHSTLPRSDKAFHFRDPETGRPLLAPTVAKQESLRLFSVATRRYLRRRAWRYFRRLGKQQPDRYVAAATAALSRYRDDDAADGLALIDNWGLLHLLFHHSPVLVSKATGWNLAAGKSLADLSPAPAYEELWRKDHAPLLQLLKQARCQPVRQWALAMLRQHFPTALGALPLAELLELICHEDSSLALLAAEGLRASGELDRLSIAQWLSLLERAHPETFALLCELIASRFQAEQISLAETLQLAGSRPTAIARLGLRWLQERRFSAEQDYQALLGLIDAQSLALRPEIIVWLRATLGAAEAFQSQWILDWLDSRHADVRQAGWEWFVAEPRAANDVRLWQKLLESPYDDIRLPLAEVLKASRATKPAAFHFEREQLDPALLRWLWAGVLLNVQRGSRAKPGIVGQITARLARRPSEAEQLLPLLAVSLRSLRGPEWRTGLAAVVRLATERPECEAIVREHFPELQWSA